MFFRILSVKPYQRQIHRGVMRQKPGVRKFGFIAEVSE